MTDNQAITVLGPRDVGQLGITDAHTHLWISDTGIEDKSAPVIDDPKLVDRELTAYRQAGGGALLDCQPGGCGRNGNQLREASRKSGIHIIACTGFHLYKYYPAQSEIWQMDSGQALDFFLSEIHLGLVETRGSSFPVYPGFIKVAVNQHPDRSPWELIEAALQASLESGLMVEMHTQAGQAVEAFIDLFHTRGFPLERLVVCHIDKRPDLGLHQALAQAGCLLEYDTFFRPKYNPEIYLWPLLRNMVEDGYGGSIACATDLADTSLWRITNQGPGLPGFLEIIKARLDAEIKDSGVVQQLVGGNIARWLTKSVTGETIL